ncbi:hypothetical protein SDC9_129782 [bioreactor metagenome]|uniref:Uncharacterized protein n=1 Tax=bioreactor metagenome TaxID=1076179 RepID=A0A645CZS3_9ZZZZ
MYIHPSVQRLIGFDSGGNLAQLHAKQQTAGDGGKRIINRMHAERRHVHAAMLFPIVCREAHAAQDQVFYLRSAHGA